MSLKSIAVIAALSMSSATYAFVPCHGDAHGKAVVCITYQNPTKNIYVDTVVNHLNIFRDIAKYSPRGDADTFMNNDSIIRGLAMHGLKMQGNEVDFYTCTDQTCHDKSRVGTFMFDFTKDSNGNYTAIPTGSYTVLLP